MLWLSSPDFHVARVWRINSSSDAPLCVVAQPQTPRTRTPVNSPQNTRLHIMAKSSLSPCAYTLLAMFAKLAATSTFLILPVGVFGSSSTKRTKAGHL